MYFSIVREHLTLKMKMTKTSFTRFFLLLFLIKAYYFSNSKLMAQEENPQPISWALILEQLNGVEDINETSKIKHLLKIGELISVKTEAPTKMELASINTNRMKLALAKILMDKKKYLWVEEIYLQMDARKLNKSECRLLFELELISLLKYPDRNISMYLLESLKSLVKSCPEELKENPGHLIDLFHFYKNKQLLNEAIEIARILWQDDEFHYHCGELHKSAYRLRWESGNTKHWNQAKYHFELIDKNYPSSQFLTNSLANLIILELEIESTLKIADIFRQKLFINIEKLSIEKTVELLDALTPIAKDTVIIQLIKDWHQLLVEKKSLIQAREIIISFLYEKCGLTINDLASLLNKGKLQSKPIPNALKNANINKKIQYLICWNSEWEPLADFTNTFSSFDFNDKLKSPIFITQIKQKEQIKLSYETKSNEILPNYIFLELKCKVEKCNLDIIFQFGRQFVEIDKIICTQEKKLIRITITDEIKLAKKWQIIIANNSNVNTPLLEISAPSFLNIKEISDLDKRIGE